MALINRIIAAFTKTHSMLPDRPSMTAAELKAWYDQSANELRSAHNGAMNDLIGTGGAGQIGAEPLVLGDTSTPTVIGKLRHLLTMMQGIVLGDIPDGTITSVKLSDDVNIELASKALFKNGSETFPLGETSYIVMDSFITEDTLVIVSPDTSVEKAGDWETVSSDGYFTVTSSEEEPANVDFDWGATK